MTNRNPRISARGHLALTLLLAGVVAFAVPGRAQAQVVISAAAFFGTCGGPITVTQNTRVSGAATVAGNCDVTVSPSVTLQFVAATVKVNALSITSTGTNAAVRVVNSGVESVTGGLDIDPTGASSSAAIVNSVLRAAAHLNVSGASVAIAGSQLTAAGALDVFGLTATITSSRLESTADSVTVDPFLDVRVTSSTLTAATDLRIQASSVGIAGSQVIAAFLNVFAIAATITSSRLETTTGFIGVEAADISVTSSTLTAATSAGVESFDGSVAITNSRLQASNGEFYVGTSAGSANVTVAGSTLTATGGSLDVVSDGVVMVTSSQLESTTQELLVQGGTKTAVASSALAAATNIFVGLFGPTSVQTSRFTGILLLIDSLNSTTSAVLNAFTGVTGPVTISGTTGCTSVKNNPDTPCS